MNLETFKNIIIKNNAKAYEVGGCVRDYFDNKFHHSGKEINDKDYVVCGFDIKSFEKAFPEAEKIGTKALIIEEGVLKEERTPVYLLDIDGEKCEVALNRSERKIRDGYSGFAFIYNKEDPIEKDLMRRDFTVNAIAKDIVTGEVVDPFNGIEDIKNRKIRGIFVKEKDKEISDDIVYDEKSKELYIRKDDGVYSSKLPQDPVRALRAARLSAKLNYEIEETTRKALSYLKTEMKSLHPDRLYKETQKAMLSDGPDVYLENLSKIGILDDIFEQLEDLKGLEQRKDFHPEGDAYNHTLQVVKAASVLTKELFPNDEARLERNVLSAISHDFGKKVTQKLNEKTGEYTYIDHEIKGVPLVEKMIDKYNIQSLKEHLRTTTAEHMYLHNNLTKVKPTKIDHFINGGYKRKSLTSEEKDTALNCLLTKNDLKGIDSRKDLEKIIEEKEEYFYQNKKRIKLSMRSGEEFRQKLVKLSDFQKADNPKEYLKNKIVDPNRINKWFKIEKTKGVKEKIDIDDYYIMCASDTLGRLKDKTNITEIFKDAANLLKENKTKSASEISKMVQKWKEKHHLTDDYAKQFNDLLTNIKVVDKVIEVNNKAVVNIDRQKLLETGKKPDEIALFKDEKIKNENAKQLHNVKKQVLQL